MQAQVMQFGKDVGTSFLFVCADFEEYSPINAVVKGLRVTAGELPQQHIALGQQMSNFVS